MRVHVPDSLPTNLSSVDSGSPLQFAKHNYADHWRCGLGGLRCNGPWPEGCRKGKPLDSDRWLLAESNARIPGGSIKGRLKIEPVLFIGAPCTGRKRSELGRQFTVTGHGSPRSAHSEFPTRRTIWWRAGGR